MKVKFFSSTNTNDLEKWVNEYLEDVSPVDLVDIKMSTCDDSCEVMVITRH